MAPENQSSNALESIADEWMIRPCKAYLEEYKDCRNIRSRFHQHFVYGKSVDCSQWRKDYDNCVKWKENHDIKAADQIIVSETERRLKRFRNHYGNTVWQKRESPPENWNKPLPDYLQKEYESTYLNVKAKELKGEVVPNTAENLSLCTIM